MSLHIRQLIRPLLASPGISALIVLTLALAIGVNTAIFSVINGVLLEPLPFPEQDRLVRIFSSKPEKGVERSGVNPLDALDFADQSEQLREVAFFQWFGLSLSGSDRPRDITTLQITHNWFETLGLQPFMGREFTRADMQVGAPKVVILGRGLWQREFGGDPGILGRDIELDGEPYEVVGLSDNLNYPEGQIQLLIPWTADLSQLTRNGHWLTVVGRLADGATLQSANAELTAIADGLAKAYPDTNAGWEAFAEPLKETVVAGSRDALTALLGIVVLVLMIACANAGNLLLGRGMARARELAVRNAMGASRGRLVTLLLGESLLLALGAGILGLLLAVAFVKVIAGTVGLSLPRLGNVELDGMVIAFNLGVSLLCAALFGLLPALRLSRDAIDRSLRESSGRQTGSPAGALLRQGFAIGATGLSLILLVAALLLARSFQQVLSVDPGYDATNVQAVQLFRSADQSARLDYAEQLMDAARAIPGVAAVGITSGLPLDYIGGGRRSVQVGGRAQSEPVLLAYRVVGGDLFDVLRMRMVAGRGFESADQRGAPVALVNESAVKQIFAGESPLGESLRVGADDATEWQIVGVVADTREVSIEEAPAPAVYLPYGGAPTVGYNLSVRLADSVSNSAAVLEHLEQIVWDADPEQSIYRSIDVDRLFEQSLAERRFYLKLVGAFALVAIVLAGVGIYAVISFGVAQRTNELGLRAALGSTAAGLLRLVMSRGLLLVGAGLVFGILGALALGGAISHLLYGVIPRDPLALLIAAGLLGMIALLACWLPALRAARLEPMQALRYE